MKQSLRFLSSVSAMNLEANLFSIPVKIKNRGGDEIQINAVYQDSNPDGAKLGTCIGLHGCPGSHKDFKYIEPLLTEAGVRFIGINFAGLGFSSCKFLFYTFMGHVKSQQGLSELKIKNNGFGYSNSIIFN